MNQGDAEDVAAWLVLSTVVTIPLLLVMDRKWPGVLMTLVVAVGLGALVSVIVWALWTVIT